MSEPLAQQDLTTRQWLCVNCGQLIEQCTCEVLTEKQHAIEVARSELIAELRKLIQADTMPIAQEVNQLYEIIDKMQTLIELLERPA